MYFAIIGGTNIDTLPIPSRQETVSTPYGDVLLSRANIPDGPEFVFLIRHGASALTDHSQVNYRANIFALESVGVTDVIGITSVGACDYSYKLGTMCLLTDFLDFTKSRPSSFERKYRKSLHIGMEDVFNPALSDALEAEIGEMEIPYSGRAIYACSEGPRFETAAEIRALRMMGAQVTGSTIVPEAPLCRELEINYSAVGIIANRCTGMTSYVTDDQIDEVMASIRGRIFDLCFNTIRKMCK